MANENCLQGLRCPECQSEEPFRIQISTSVLLYDEGCEPTTVKADDIYWDAHSNCTCVACGYEGTIEDFKVELKPYSVLLHCPPSPIDPHRNTFYTFVYAESPGSAVQIARQTAVGLQDAWGLSHCTASDFALLLVTDGHHGDYSCEEGRQQP